MAWEPFGWDIDWGNVPAWAGSILTSGSLALGFSILRRDRQKEEREQASKVGASLKSTDGKLHHVSSVYIVVSNNSDALVSDCRIFAIPRSEREIIRICNGPEQLEEAYRLAEERPLNRPVPFEHDHAVAFYTEPLDSNEDPNIYNPYENKLFIKGDTTTRTFVLPLPVSWYRVELTFVDMSGRRWHRDLTTGALSAKKLELGNIPLRLAQKTGYRPSNFG